MIKWIKVAFAFLLHMVKRFEMDAIARMAASLSYSTLLALVPFLIISFYVLSPFPVFKGVGHMIQLFIVKNFIGDLAVNIDAQLTGFVKQMHDLRWTNICALCFVSMLMMFNIVRSFNAIWQTHLRYNIALSFLMYMAIVVFAPIIFAIVIFITPYIYSLKLIHGILVYKFVNDTFLKLLPVFSAFIVFTVFNWLLPSEKVKFKTAVLCGLITALAFDGAKMLFALYLRYFSSYKIIYGALATIPFFLVWIYISWLIVLIGVQLCHIMSIGLAASRDIVQRAKPV